MFTTKYDLLGPPSAPDTVSVQFTTYNSATIQWTVPSDNGGSAITGYNITISHNITELDHTINYTLSVAVLYLVTVA